ncbi:nucleosome assembly, partial [Perkinsus olseni]
TPRRTFVGKAAWERGQLEREMNLGVWYPVKVTSPEALRKIMLGRHDLSEDDLWAAMVTESCGSPEMARLPVSAAKVVRSDLNVDWGYSSDNDDDEEWGSAVASERGRGASMPAPAAASAEKEEAPTLPQELVSKLLVLDDDYTKIQKRLEREMRELEKSYDKELTPTIEARAQLLAEPGEQGSNHVKGFWKKVLRNSTEFEDDVEEWDLPVLEY